MKAGLRYQNGCMYEHHGAWYVRYRQRILQEDGSAKLNHASKHLGRSGVLIPRLAREPGQTHAYDLDQVLQILDLLPLLAKTLVAIATFAGLRQGELRGLDWTDYTGSELAINRSIWMSVVNLPKTRASRDTVPVIPALAEILDEYRRSMGNPKAGMIFHSGNERPISVDKVWRRVIRPALVGTHLPWYGWHAFRRGLASNLYSLGAQDKVVQRILRHEAARYQGTLY